MTSSEKPTLVALKPALQGGNTLSPFTGAQATKDGAKEDLKSLDLLKVYTFLYPHKNVGAAKSTGETLVSCFNDSGHSNGDQNPSMALNNIKNTYHCFGCEASGDILDLIAVRKGYANSANRCPDDMIHQAVFDANQDLNLGWEFHRASDGRYYRGPARGVGATNIIQMPTGLVAPEPVIQPIPEPKIEELRPLDWRNLVENDTALKVYMELVSVDDIAEEFHFWNFLILLGLLIGRDATFKDATPVHGNMFVCLSGPTSAGKSRSMGYIKRLMKAPELKFDEDDPHSDGIKTISGPGSGEALTKSFKHETVITAPPSLVPGGNTAKPIQTKVSHPVRGLVEYEELATIVKKSESKGSTIKPTLIELFDCGPTIGGSSLSGGNYEAEGAYGSLLTSTQPEILERTFAGTDDAVSGFLNRWIFVPGNHKKKRALLDYIDVDPVIPYLIDIREWAAEIKRSHNSMVEFMYQEQRDRFIRFFENVIEKHQEVNGLQRIHLLYKKFTLLGCALYMDDHISDRALDFAEYLVEWLIESNKYQEVNELDSTERIRIKQRIEEITLKAGTTGIAPSQLRQRVIGKRKNVDSDYDYVFTTMVSDQEIMQFEPNGSRKKRVMHFDHYMKLTHA